MKLIERVPKRSSQQVADYLRYLSREKVEQLRLELQEYNIRGMTSLHLAIERGNLEMVEVLLDFGATLETMPGVKTIPDYAYELAKKNNFSKKTVEIYALVKTRSALHTLTHQELKISFPHLLRSIRSATENLHHVRGVNAILLLGATGVGKSTLANFLSGVNYQYHETVDQKRVKALGPELVETSSGTTSATTFPQIIKLPKNRISLIDTPGFEDTRGTIEEICAAASVCLITQQLQGIQQLWLICSWSGLADSRMIPYRNAAQKIGAMLSLNPRVANRLTLVITQFKEGLKANHVRERLKKLFQQEGWDKTSMNESRLEEIPMEEWKKQCVRRTTQAILAYQNNILLADVTSLPTRDDFQKYLTKLDGKPVNVDQFNFQFYSHHIHQFKRILETVMKYFINLKTAHNELVVELKKWDNSVTKNNKLIQKCSTELDRLQKDLQEFDQKPYLHAIQQMQATVHQLTQKKSEILRSKKQTEEELKKNQSYFIRTQVSSSAEHDLDQAISNLSERLRNDRGNLELEKEYRELLDLKDIVQIQKNSVKKAQNFTESSLQNYQIELWEISDKLREQEIKIAEQKQRMQTAQEVHESSINLALKRKEMLTRDREQFVAEKDTLIQKRKGVEQKILVSESEIRVNHKLIVPLLEISHIFKFDQKEKSSKKSIRGEELKTNSLLSELSKIQEEDKVGEYKYKSGLSLINSGEYDQERNIVDEFYILYSKYKISLPNLSTKSVFLNIFISPGFITVLFLTLGGMMIKNGMTRINESLVLGGIIVSLLSVLGLSQITSKSTEGEEKEQNNNSTYSRFFANRMPQTSNTNENSCQQIELLPEI